jgi:hypothetical protein
MTEDLERRLRHLLNEQASHVHPELSGPALRARASRTKKAYSSTATPLLLAAAVVTIALVSLVFIGRDHRPDRPAGPGVTATSPAPSPPAVSPPAVPSPATSSPGTRAPSIRPPSTAPLPSVVIPTLRTGGSGLTVSVVPEPTPSATIPQPEIIPSGVIVSPRSTVAQPQTAPVPTAPTAISVP